MTEVDGREIGCIDDELKDVGKKLKALKQWQQKLFRLRHKIIQEPADKKYYKNWRRTRYVVNLREQDNLTYREIGERLNLSTTRARTIYEQFIEQEEELRTWRKSSP